MTWTGCDYYCDNCRCYISGTREDCLNDSICYAPDVHPGYDLCSGCAADEEADEEKRGTNDMPERVSRYQRNRIAIESNDF